MPFGLRTLTPSPIDAGPSADAPGEGAEASADALGAGDSFDFEDEFEADLDVEGDDEAFVDFEFEGEQLEEEAIDLRPDQRAAIDAAFDGIDNKTLYEILLLPRHAEARIIKRAYYKLSKEYHPDKYYRKRLGPYKERLERVFNRVTEAYRVLSDPATRAEYDETLPDPNVVAPVASVRRAPDLPDEAGRQEATTHVDFVPEALRRKQEEALKAKRQELLKKAKKRSSVAPKPKPLFLQNFEKQLAGRIGRSRKQLELGKEAQEKGDLQAAVNHYQMAMTLDPRNPKAKALFKRANAAYRNSRAEDFFRQAQDAKLAEDHRKAAEMMQKAVECRPTRGKYHNEFGKHVIEHTLQQRVGLELLRKAVEIEGRNLGYVEDLARAYNELGMPSNAVRAYERVLQLDPKNSEAIKALKKLK